MRTANPAFNDSAFPAYSARAGYGETMTIDGTINRTGILLLCVLATAAWTWSQFFATRDPAVVGPYVLVGALGGFVMAMVRSGLIRATEKFKIGIVAATGGIAVVYILSMVLGLFGVQIPGIFGSSPIGILFSVVVVVVAALNLILDFDFIEQGALRGAPKYMEWYAAFGLMVTLIWLYLEIIRLLSKLRDRR
jgi:uncharacterized YccA/Bax inhibitor family protein